MKPSSNQVKYVFFWSLVTTLFANVLMAQISYQDEINLSGKVTDISGKAVPQAIVTLKTANISDTTDNQGSFSLIRNAASGISKGFLPTPGNLFAEIHSNQLNLHLPNQSVVLIKVHSLNGNLISTRREQLKAGNHTLAMPPAPDGMWYYIIKAGSEEIQFKFISISNNQHKNMHSHSSSRPVGLSKQTAIINDTLKVTKAGFNEFYLGINNPVQSGLVIKLSANTTDPGDDTDTIVNGCHVKMEGWAAYANTTGGGKTTPQKVTSVNELRTLSKDEVPRVLLLEGTYDLGASYLRVGSNKTFLGVGKSTVVKAAVAVFSLRQSHNVILRNFTVSGGGDVGTEGGDAITATNAERLWFDHLTITDGPDGILDLTQGTTNVTISWCKIYYTNSSQPHRYAMQFSSGSYVGSAVTDRGKLDITMHHNWFGNLVDQRMPRHLWGRGHIYNNYYNSPNNQYCIGGGSWASLLIENNYFKDVKDPHRFQDACPTYIAAPGNIYDKTTGEKSTGLFAGKFPGCETGGADAVIPGPWTPPYKYSLDDAKGIPELVMRCAGPQ